MLQLNLELCTVFSWFVQFDLNNVNYESREMIVTIFYYYYMIFPRKLNHICPSVWFVDDHTNYGESTM